jgi:hypothetical protein
MQLTPREVAKTSCVSTQIANEGAQRRRNVPPLRVIQKDSREWLGEFLEHRRELAPVRILEIERLRL